MSLDMMLMSVRLVRFFLGQEGCGESWKDLIGCGSQSFSHWECEIKSTEPFVSRGLRSSQIHQVHTEPSQIAKVQSTWPRVT